MKIIRWGGFLSFFLISGLIAAGGIFFAESFVRDFLQSQLTDMNGARANIDKVDIHYSPFSLDIRNIQITDPQNPMTNSVQIENARFNMSLGNLFLKKVIINEMSISGIRIDTPRKTSGALKKKAEVKKAPGLDDAGEKLFEIPEIELPDIKELLQKEPLISDTAFKKLDQDIEATRDNWKSTSDKITDKARWDNYETRYKQIERNLKGNFQQKISAVQEAKTLKDDLEKEIEQISNARRQFNQDWDRLETEFKDAKAAPRQDIDRIKKKYSLDNLNAENISQLLFGPQAAEYMALARKWYQRLKPYIEDDEPREIPVERSKGRDIKFAERNPMPDFYVGKASIDAQLPRGEFVGSITHISSDQSINKQPMRMLLQGKNMKHRNSEEITAEFNYVNKNKGFSLFNYTLTGYQLNDFNISKQEKLSLSIDKALMDFKIQSRLEKGQLDGTSLTRFEQVNFSSNKSSTGKSMTAMIASSFADIKQFDINTRFKGSLHSLSFKIDSDLDNKLGAQMKTKLNQRKEQFETELKQRLQARIEEPLQRIEQKRQQLNALKSELDAKEQALKQRIDYLKEKIQGEAELKKQEAKSKIENKKKEELDKLKQKLKDKLKL